VLPAGGRPYLPQYQAATCDIHRPAGLWLSVGSGRSPGPCWSSRFGSRRFGRSRVRSVSGARPGQLGRSTSGRSGASRKSADLPGGTFRRRSWAFGPPGHSGPGYISTPTWGPPLSLNTFVAGTVHYRTVPPTNPPSWPCPNSSHLGVPIFTLNCRTRKTRRLGSSSKCAIGTKNQPSYGLTVRPSYRPTVRHHSAAHPANPKLNRQATRAFGRPRSLPGENSAFRLGSASHLVSRSGPDASSLL
jgi:hypothetical protein